MKELEESLVLSLDFGKLGSVYNQSSKPVIPVVVQHVDTKDVLILAYVSEEALKKSLELKKAVFWSTSRNELWIKGETSGDTLDLFDVRVNCEQNSLLFLVKPRHDGVCHTKDSQGKSRPTCYYRSFDGSSLTFLSN